MSIFNHVVGFFMFAAGKVGGKYLEENYFKLYTPFTIHVQDRNFSKAEVLKMLNSESAIIPNFTNSWSYPFITQSTLTMLSGKGTFSSMANIFEEVTKFPWITATLILGAPGHVGNLVTSVLGSFYGEKWYGEHFGNQYIGLRDSYSGKEIVEYLNALHSARIHFDFAGMDKITKDFIDGKYSESNNVPTIDQDHGWWGGPQAVLVTEHPPILVTPIQIAESEA